MTALTLGFDLSFEDLYDDRALARVDAAFLDLIGTADRKSVV